MKILQVTRQFHPARGGIESVVWNLGKELCARGHEVGVVTLNRLWDDPRLLPPFEIISGIRVYRIPFYGSRRYALSPAVLNYLYDYDLVAIHSADFYLDFLSNTRGFHGKPLVLHTHGLYFHSHYAQRLKQFYFLTVTRLALTRVSAILCDSTQDFHLLGRVADSSKLYLMPNGVDPAFFTPLRFNRQPYMLVSVGRLSTNKRHDRLLQTIHCVKKEKQQIRLVVIGRDQGEKEHLIEKRGTLNLNDNVLFLGDTSQQDLMDYLAQATLWVSASQYESFGIGLLEGMAAGCIPVVSDIPAFRELVVNGENGFVVDFDFTEQAANVIVQALELPPEAISRMAEKARIMASHYSWELVANKIEALYQHVLEREKRST